MAEAYERAKNILWQNNDSFTKLAELLLQKEVIFKEGLETIWGKTPDEKIITGETKDHCCCFSVIFLYLISIIVLQNRNHYI